MALKASYANLPAHTSGSFCLSTNIVHAQYFSNNSQSSLLVVSRLIDHQLRVGVLLTMPTRRPQWVKIDFEGVFLIIDYFYKNIYLFQCNNFIHLCFHEIFMKRWCVKLWQNICSRRAGTNRDTRIVFTDTTFATFQSRKADFAYQLIKFVPTASSASVLWCWQNGSPLFSLPASKKVYRFSPSYFLRDIRCVL